TTFRIQDGSPFQVIVPPCAVELPIRELEEQALARTLTEEARRPFDLTRDRLLRVALFRLRSEDHVLLIVLHHIASDAWSVGVLERELTAFYDALAAGGPSALPELPITYADYAGWQRDWLSGARLAEQIAYWRRQLDGAPATLELPTDQP